MMYPGHVVKIGESDAAIVRFIVARLEARGHASSSPSGVFDKNLKSLLKLFQSQNVDTMGNPLDPDGEVGLLTWGALGGEVPASVVIPGGSLGELAVGEAIARVGVREKPPGSNRGPEVQAYLGSVGVAPGNPWCMAFVSFCIQEAAKKSGKISTFPRTGGCLDAWNKVKAAHPMNLVTRAAAMANVAKVVPGMVFVLDLGDGHGHTGFVKANHGGSLITVEGNSNATGGSDGVGVFELNRRGVMDRVMKGFIAVP